MPVYRITFKCEAKDCCDGGIRYNHSASPEEAAYWYKSCHTLLHPIVRVRLDRTYEARQANRERWKDTWQNALNNMPKMTRRLPPKGRHKEVTVTEFGHYFALARCLDMKISRAKLRHHWRTDMQIKFAMSRGYEPRDPTRKAKLLKLAGPHGAVIARIKLINLGRVHLYKVWPK
jgi:hypothetical protein